MATSGARRSALAVCVDYDGTITDLDTFDLLVRESATAQEWRRLEAHLHDGAMTLRDVLQEEAHFVRASFDDVDAMLARRATVDPTFPPFVARCEVLGIPVTILSSGVGSLIERALHRSGVGHVEVLANDAIPSPNGWTMTFRDTSDNGHDKAAAVRALQANGMTVAFIGDGHSDFDASLEADIRYVKRGRSLERFLTGRGEAFTPFDSFAEIEATLLR